MVLAELALAGGREADLASCFICRAVVNRERTLLPINQICVRSKYCFQSRFMLLVRDKSAKMANNAVKSEWWLRGRHRCRLGSHIREETVDQKRHAAWQRKISKVVLLCMAQLSPEQVESSDGAHAFRFVPSAPLTSRRARVVVG